MPYIFTCLLSLLRTQINIEGTLFNRKIQNKRRFISKWHKYFWQRGKFFLIGYCANKGETFRSPFVLVSAASQKSTKTEGTRKVRTEKKCRNIFTTNKTYLSSSSVSLLVPVLWRVSQKKKPSAFQEKKRSFFFWNPNEWQGFPSFARVPEKKTRRL